MNENHCKVAYTVMTEDHLGHVVFLVFNDHSEYYFPLAKAHKNQTGLATALTAMKSELNMNIDCLELAELTNIVANGHRIPLFLFHYQCEKQVIDILPPNSEMTWIEYDHLSERFEEWEFSGVPQF